MITADRTVNKLALGRQWSQDPFTAGRVDG